MEDGIHSLKRFLYWLNLAEFKSLKFAFLKMKRRIMPVTGTPCKIMHPEAGLCCVFPLEWNKMCNRQGSWYRSSSKNGKILVASSKPLRLISDKLSCVVSPVEFSPGKLAEESDISQMIKASSFRKRAPEGWFEQSISESIRFAKLLSYIGVISKSKNLIDWHSANHANFIEPRFFVKENDEIVPYSISGTGKVCSCCIELFNIVGEDFKRKYVMPCPGYVVFAKAPADKFLLVESNIR
jgi:hypothetical protein